MPTLRCVVTRMEKERIDLGTEYLNLLRIAVSHFEAANGSVEVEFLDADHIRKTMRYLQGKGRSIETINAVRRRLLLLWQTANGEFRWKTPPIPRYEVRGFKRVKRLPTAWRPNELNALLNGCDKMPPSKWWGPRHDRALVMTIYDTSTRVGALLKSIVTQLDQSRCAIFIPGDKQKGRADTYQPIHPDTMQLLLELERPAGDKRLFPIPFKRRYFFVRYGKLLKLSGLPDTRRDKTHRIRRTSYTMVAVQFGKEAAGEHAAHKSDMSEHYLDPSFLPKPNPLDALPRP